MLGSTAEKPSALGVGRGGLMSLFCLPFERLMQRLHLILDDNDRCRKVKIGVTLSGHEADTLEFLVADRSLWRI